MKTFYVTFGCGTIFAGYYAVLEAKDENIARAFMNKHYRSIWSSIYTDQPKRSEPLKGKPTALYYSRMEDV